MAILNDSVWAKLAPSLIDGVGVFAIRDIPKGQKIYEIGKREWLSLYPTQDIHPSILRLVEQRWPLAFNGAPFWSPNDDAHLPSFMNHSDTPNVSIDMVALEFIPNGTELTEQYPPECVLQFEHEKA